MRVLRTWSRRSLAVATMLSLAGTSARVQAQENQHVVSLKELQKDTARPGDTRQANEAAVRDIFSSETAQKALKSAKVDYQRIDKAVGQLSDEDLARLADRSRHVKQDFAAGSGNFSDRDLLIIVIIGVLVIALVAALH
jgi:hypothetical protein